MVVVGPTIDRQVTRAVHTQSDCPLKSFSKHFVQVILSKYFVLVTRSSTDFVQMISSTSAFVHIGSHRLNPLCTVPLTSNHCWLVQVLQMLFTQPVTAVDCGDIYQSHHTRCTINHLVKKSRIYGCPNQTSPWFLNCPK